MLYRIFGFWIRRQACKLAAQSVQGQAHEGNISRRLWALAVFYERYMIYGATETQEEFASESTPVKLTIVSSRD